MACYNLVEVKNMPELLSNIPYKTLLERWRKEGDTEIADYLSSNNLFKNKSLRTFGVEIEFLMEEEKLHNLPEALARKGISCRKINYTKEITSYWKLVTDASVRTSSVGVTGMEIVSPILKGKKGKIALETVCEVLNELGASINRTCGLHVHVGIGDLKLTQLYDILRFYQNNEDFIDSLVSPSRRNSNFCKRFPRQLILSSSSDYNRFVDNLLPTRYYKVNIKNVNTRGTLEFRQHQGTTNYTKVANWIDFILGIVKYIKYKINCNSEDVFRCLELNIDQIDYWNRTISKFRRGD